MSSGVNASTLQKLQPQSLTALVNGSSINLRKRYTALHGDAAEALRASTLSLVPDVDIILSRMSACGVPRNVQLGS
jgi:hypothetical protein